jgi:hypothetical protein
MSHDDDPIVIVATARRSDCCAYWGGVCDWITAPDIELHASCAIQIAGITAELAVFGTLGKADIAGAIGDIYEIESDLRAHLPVSEHRAAIRRAFATAEAILQERRPALDAVAAALESKGRLTSAEVCELAKLPAPLEASA